MRQRLAIARGLLHSPKLIFLDEPSRSLDPVATARLHDLIRLLNGEQGVTVFLITHDLAEAETLCQRVAVMHAGQIQVAGRPEDLRRQLKPKTGYQIMVDTVSQDAHRAMRRLLPDFYSESYGQGIRLSFSIQDGGAGLSKALDTLREHGTEIQGIESRPPTLEEVFAHYSRQEDGVK
jgi:ABC-2 type transport system ATP-binding protein